MTNKHNNFFLSFFIFLFSFFAVANISNAQLTVEYNEIETSPGDWGWRYGIETGDAEWYDLNDYPGGGVGGFHYVSEFASSVDASYLSTNTVTVWNKFRHGNSPTSNHSSQTVFNLTSTQQLDITLNDFRWGMYRVNLLGFVPSWVWSDSPGTKVLPPNPIVCRVDNGIGGTTNYYTIQPYYDNKIARLGPFDINNVYGTNDINMTFYMNDDYTHTMKIWAIEVQDMLNGAPRDTLYKTAYTTYTAAELAANRQFYIDIEDDDYYLRPYYEWRQNNRPVIANTGWGSSSRTNRDNSIWNSPIPANWPYLGLFNNGNGYNMPNNPSETLSWAMNSGATMGWDDQFSVTDGTTTYTAQDFWNDPTLTVSGERLYGLYTTNSSGVYTWYNTLAENLTPVWDSLTPFTNMETGGYLSHIGLRYHYSGEENAGYDGMLQVAAVAFNFPSYWADARDASIRHFAGAGSGGQTSNPYGAEPNERRKQGMFYYDGYPDAAHRLLYGYDYLFEYLDNGSNVQHLVDSVTRKVPWINNDLNNFKLFLQGYIIWPCAQIVDSGRVRYMDQGLVGLVAGSGPIANQYLDPRQGSFSTIYGNPNGQPLSYHQAGTPDRHDIQGTRSTVYDSPFTIGNAITFSKAAQSGFTLDEPWNDVTKPGFGKSEGYRRYLSHLMTAGGYASNHGSSGDRWNFGPNYGYLGGALNWESYYLLATNTTMAPFFAKTLKDYYGKTLSGDAGIIQTGLAAQADRTVELPGPSVALEDYFHKMEFQGYNTNRMKRGSALVWIGTGDGHSHYDFLSLNIYAKGFRAGVDHVIRESDNAYPTSYGMQGHNTMNFETWRHPERDSDGWPNHNSASDTQDTVAYAKIFKTNNIFDFSSTAAAYDGDFAHITTHTRDVALIRVNDDDFVVFDNTRVNGPKFASWTWHGAYTDIETNGFTWNLQGVATNAFGSISSSGISPGYFLRKHVFKPEAYAPMIYEEGTNFFEAAWRLGRGAPELADLSVLANGDNNGDANVLDVTNTEERMHANYSAANPRFWTRVKLFDRGMDAQARADFISGVNDSYQPRVHSFQVPESNTYTANTAKSARYTALHDHYFEGSEVLTSAVSNLETANHDSPSQITFVAAGDTFKVGSSIEEDITQYTADSLTWKGQFALYREDSTNNFKVLSILGGTEVTHGNYSLKPDDDVLSDVIRTVNYSNSFFTLADWPGVKFPQHFRITYGDNDVETEWYVTNIVDETNFYYMGEPRTGMRMFGSISGSSLNTPSSRGKPAWGHRPTRKYAAVGNEAFTKASVISDVSNSSTMTIVGGTYSDSISDSDFTDVNEDGYTDAYLYRFGPDMTVRTPSTALLEANGSDYYFTANTQTELTLPGNDGDIINIDGNALSTSYAAGKITAIIPVAQLTGYQQDITITQGQSVSLPNISVTNDGPIIEGSGETKDFTITRDETTGSLTVYFSLLQPTTGRWSRAVLTRDYTASETASVTMADGVASATVTITAVESIDGPQKANIDLAITSNANYAISSPGEYQSRMVLRGNYRGKGVIQNNDGSSSILISK